MKAHYHNGKCALCGKECKLTFEHIPPRSAFNSTPAKPVSMEELLKGGNFAGRERLPWETGGLKYQNQQQGMGRYSLCKTCNSHTGKWYGDAYITFAKIASDAIRNLSVEESSRIGFKEIYPLRIIKQIFSLFCSINGIDNPKLEPIRKFVLDKDAVGIDKTQFKLCMYFTKSTLMKQAPMAVSLKICGDKSEIMALSEITAYPFGFILYFDPTESWDYHGVDITCFADVDFNTKANIEMPWRIEEMNNFLPEDFRTKEEIIKCIEENQKWIDEHPNDFRKG